MSIRHFLLLNMPRICFIFFFKEGHCAFIYDIFTELCNEPPEPNEQTWTGHGISHQIINKDIINLCV